jgi:4-hydroxy-3-methylbut-2-enyl diphosphate reductase
MRTALEAATTENLRRGAAMTIRSWTATNAMAHLDALAPGEIVVPDVVGQDGQEVRNLAAPVLAGTLRRRGISVREALVETPGRPGPGTTPVVLRSTPLAGGMLGLAARADDPAALHACADWAAAADRVVRPREVRLAAPRSFCAGVERAIEVVERELANRGSVYVRKQIVHNTSVVADLERRGAVFVDDLADVPVGATVVFSAHGVSPAVRAHAAERELDVIDATCPLVMKVHTEARRFAARGDTVVLIGHAGHEETEGTLGHAPESMLLVENVEDVADLPIPAGGPVSYLTQTTLAVDDTSEVVAALRERFPQLTGPPTDDICYATTNRQRAVRAVVEGAELMLVVGSTNSSNSLRLVELARSLDTPARLIDSAGDLDLDWLAGVEVIGLTAGASAPPALVNEVVTALRGLGPVRLSEHRVTTETVRFALPKEVRAS